MPTEHQKLRLRKWQRRISQGFCEERSRLDKELALLLDNKSALREQIADGVIKNPAERRAKLTQTDEMIDDVIELIHDHPKHCSCEGLSPIVRVKTSSSSLATRQPRKAKPLLRFQS